MKSNRHTNSFQQMEKKDKMSSKTVPYSLTNDFKETIDLIEKLLELHIGDAGRLIYIKNSLKKGKYLQGR